MKEPILISYTQNHHFRGFYEGGSLPWLWLHFSCRTRSNIRLDSPVALLAPEMPAEADEF
jgi:hypothetical protein